MDPVDLQVLRCFRAVAGGATVTEAAVEAHLTQPALSRALRRLEREAGAELLSRVGRVLRLTPAGHVFARHVTAMLEHYDRGVREVAELVDPEAGLISVAFLHTLGTWLVPSLLSSFRADHPQARFELRQHGEAGLMAELLTGGADLVITSGDPGDQLITW